MTSIPAVKAALVTLAATALPNSQAIYGPVSAVTTTKPRVFAVGNVVGTRELDSLESASAVERYIVDLAISVDLAGTGQQAADELALTDYAALVAAVRADITLGLGDSVAVTPVGQFELREQADADGRHAAVLFSVSVFAVNV